MEISNQTSQTQQIPNQTPTPVNNSRNSKFVPIILAVAAAIVIAIGAYVLGTKQSQPVVQNIVQTTPIPSPIPTIDETANWKTFESKEINFSLKYPPAWTIKELSESGKTVGVDLIGSEGEIHAVWGTGFGGGCPGGYEKLVIKNESLETCHSVNNDNTESWEQISKEISKSMGFSARAYANAPYQNNRDTVLNILSTFKFTSDATSGTPAPATYKPGSNWHTVNNTTLGLNFCLPPKWDFSKNGDGTLSGNLIFYRDAGYAPTVAFIESIPYSGGSHRDAYFKHWESEIPSIRESVSIKDTDINGSIALTIESKSPPGGDLKVVWYSNGKLWEAGLSDWQSVNPSRTAFLKDFYTAINCSL